MTSATNPTNPAIPHASALAVAILAPLAGAAVILVTKLDPAAVPYVAALAGIVSAGGFGSHFLALFNQGRDLATKALPTAESIVSSVMAAFRGQTQVEPVDYAKLAESLAPMVLQALPSLVAAHVSPAPAPAATILPDAAETVPALPRATPPPLPVDLSPAALDRAKATIAAAKVAGLALILCALAFLGCSTTQPAGYPTPAEAAAYDLAVTDCAVTGTSRAAVDECRREAAASYCANYPAMAMCPKDGGSDQ